MRFAYRTAQGHSVGHYELNPFPGCNQLVVSNHTYIQGDRRGQGHGYRMGLERVLKARELGYDYLLCTVVATNGAQLALCRKLGYTRIAEFKNRETGNDVYIFGLAL